jgi:glyoxylase-like metal-dependent hydrolase (beta-lactamase superfamily II)
LRVVSVHRDAVVVTSRLWQTNAVALRAGSETMLIDSPYFPDELEALPSLLAGAGLEPDALLATHGDFDHLLGRLAFPALSLGLAESTMLRIRAEPGQAQRDLRDYDGRHYVDRAAPLGLGQVQSLPVPGKLELGDEELELHPSEGHTEDGMAVWAPWCGVLACGDYLSDVEIPTVSAGGSLGEYRATLGRLAPLIERAEVTAPGHGSPHDRETALRLLDEDLEYLDALERDGERAPLPAGRDSRRQREIHVDNARKHAAG